MKTLKGLIAATLSIPFISVVILSIVAGPDAAGVGLAVFWQTGFVPLIVILFMVLVTHAALKVIEETDLKYYLIGGALTGVILMLVVSASMPGLTRGGFVTFIAFVLFMIIGLIPNYIFWRIAIGKGCNGEA
ncbi:hypothetical protein [Sulfurovum sp.]|uniref:hypothetical protein n=1 Tax=Sulfurovum sp. TaxID=1969726 RepID=UPI0035633828